jgi:hypothetical protein
MRTHEDKSVIKIDKLPFFIIKSVRLSCEIKSRSAASCSLPLNIVFLSLSFCDVARYKYSPYCLTSSCIDVVTARRKILQRFGCYLAKMDIVRQRQKLDLPLNNQHRKYGTMDCSFEQRPFYIYMKRKKRKVHRMEQRLEVVRTSQMASLVSPEKRLNGFSPITSSSRFMLSEESDAGGWPSGPVTLMSADELRIWARCFFKSAKVPAFIVTDTWMLIFLESSSV